jgi:hypothetical protein
VLYEALKPRPHLGEGRGFVFHVAGSKALNVWISQVALAPEPFLGEERGSRLAGLPSFTSTPAFTTKLSASILGARRNAIMSVSKFSALVLVVLGLSLFSVKAHAEYSPDDDWDELTEIFEAWGQDLMNDGYTLVIDGGTRQYYELNTGNGIYQAYLVRNGNPPSVNFCSTCR